MATAPLPLEDKAAIWTKIVQEKYPRMKQETPAAYEERINRTCLILNQCSEDIQEISEESERMLREMGVFAPLVPKYASRILNQVASVSCAEEYCQQNLLVQELYRCTLHNQAFCANHLAQHQDQHHPELAKKRNAG